MMIDTIYENNNIALLFRRALGLKNNIMSGNINKYKYHFMNHSEFVNIKYCMKLNKVNYK